MVIREGQGLPNVNDMALRGITCVRLPGSHGRNILRGRGITEQDTDAARNVAA